MIGEMLVWGFFSALGWMAANWTVDKVFPDKPPAIEKKVDENKIDEKNDGKNSLIR